MSKAKITIVDYQMGNLRSVQKALEHVGYCAEVSSDPEQIASAEKLILPGVGAFGDAIAELERRSLVEPIKESIRAGKPFLGICLGLQMLFDIGYEGGELPGLGIIGGSVERFSLQPGMKVPHMGWNQVQVRQPNCPLLRDIPITAYFYFVHSYYVLPGSDDSIWLTSDYGGPFCAAVWQDNLFATQFHPEKSQQDGLRMLSNFASL
ncbi:MAG: imidazole glycerol phosphate synthase subunit HisH [Planctomycetales bacterium]|nr:imidazole glycerol phosphate synthase subunit HisH [Planctomycetales bacterium]